MRCVSQLRGALAFFVLLGFPQAAAAQQGPLSPLAAQPYENKLLSEHIDVDGHGVATETIHVQVKANNAATAQQIGQQPIAYSEALADLDIVDAFTLKADGRKIAVATSAIYSQLPQGAPQVPMFDDLRQKVMIFPDVEAGDTIDFTVRLRGKQATMPGQFMFERSFSRLASFDDVEITVSAPRTYPLVTEAHEVAFERQDNGPNAVYHWHYAGRATLETDTSVLAPFDRSPRFVISSFKDYDALARAFAALVAPTERVTPQIQALANDITAGVTDRKAQAQRLYEWVSRRIRYVGIEVGVGAIVPHDAEVVLANGYGDCKDHVVLYSALLKAKGIASDFILINLGNSYALPNTPVIGSLNHAITYLPEFGLYADTTAGVAPFGSLPFQEYGKPIVHAVASGNALGHTPVLPPGLATVSTRTVAKLDASGRFTGTSAITASGPFSLLLRQIGLGIEAVGSDRAAIALIQKANAQGTGSFNLTPPTDLAPSYTLGTMWSFGPFAEVAQGRRFAMPAGIAVLGLPGDVLVGSLINGNGKGSDPIPCYSGREEDDVFLDAPPGQHFLQSPPDATIKTAHISFNTHWSLAGSTLHLHRAFISQVETALCAGSTRAEIDNALAAIRQTYSYGAAIAPDSADKPVSSLDTFRVAEEKTRIGDDTATRQLNAGAPSLPDVSTGVIAALTAPHNDTASVRPAYSPVLVDDGQALKRGAAPVSGHLAGAIDARRDLVAAEGTLTSAIGANAKSASLYERRGAVRGHLGRFDDAAADFGKAIALAASPDESSRYYTERGTSYWMARDFRPALSDFSQAVRLNDANAAAHQGRGRSELFAGRLRDAVADLAKAASLGGDPYSTLWLYIAEARAGKGASSIERSKLDAAIARARAASVQEFYLGELTLMNGDRAKAAEHFRAAHAAKSNDQTEVVAAGIELDRLAR